MIQSPAGLSGMNSWKKGIDENLRQFTAKVFPSTFDYSCPDCERAMYYYNSKKELVLLTWGSDQAVEASFYLRDNQLFMIDASQVFDGNRIERYIYYPQGENPQYLFKGKAETFDHELEFRCQYMYNKALDYAEMAQRLDANIPKELDFSGRYEWLSDNVRDGTSEAQLLIQLEQKEAWSNELTGGFSAYVGFGSKLEEGENPYACAINGRAYSDIAILQCRSCYSDKTFVAYLLYREGRFVWFVNSTDYTAWVPAKAEMSKE